jgi:hypothetical protein
MLRYSLAVLLLVAPLSAADFASASANAHNWLKSQMASTGLVDSYKDRSDVCYTYDQAVATIAFAARNDQVSAQRVLDALASMQNDDGSWNSAYACKTKASLSNARYVGGIAWVVVAIAHYERQFDDPITYRVTAERALNWIMLFMQSDGGINGGLNADGVPFPWASTEHNEDAHGALRYFGYGDYSDVRGFLDNVVYDVAQDRWFQGRNDTYDPLDVNPLGVLALGATGAHPYYKSLDFSLARFRNTQVWGKGKSRVTVDGFDFEADKNDVWLEGTAQMSIALRVAGRATLADYFANQLIAIQQTSGGVPYSVKGSFSAGFQMSKAEAVASTGWLVIALEGVNPLELN